MNDIVIIIISVLIPLTLLTLFGIIATRAYRYKNTGDSEVFHGGAWVSFASATWPFGLLIVKKDSIVLKIEGLGKDYELTFTKENLEKIEIKKFFFGVKFVPKPYKIAYFWYFPFKLKTVTNTLKEYGWMQ